MTRPFISTVTLAIVAVCFSAWQAADAQDTAVRVLASNGIKAALEELEPQCARAIGHPLALQFSSTAALKKKIEAGEKFDVTVISAEAIADLIRQGKLAGDSRTALARSELGIGIRAKAARPDIRTSAALKQTLLDAKSITYPQDGATRSHIEKTFADLGIAGNLKPKIILAPSSGAATGSVASGQAALVITLFSEIVPVAGVEILGPLPSEYRDEVRFQAAISTAAQNVEAGKRLIAFLAGPKAAPIYKAKGLEPAGHTGN